MFVFFLNCALCWTLWSSLQCGSDGKKKSTCSAGDLGSIPGLGRAPGGGHGNPLHGDSCLENPHGQRSLVGYSPWGLRESDVTEWRSTAHCQDVIENVIISYTIFLRTSGKNRYWYILALAAKVKLQSQNWAHHSKCRLTCLALFWLFFFILPFQAPFFIFILFLKKIFLL